VVFLVSFLFQTWRTTRPTNHVHFSLVSKKHLITCLFHLTKAKLNGKCFVITYATRDDNTWLNVNRILQYIVFTGNTRLCGALVRSHGGMLIVKVGGCWCWWALVEPGRISSSPSSTDAAMLANCTPIDASAHCEYFRV
jgi:hypothetical protein